MNKSRTRGIFYRNGIAYIRYQDEQGSIVKESTRQGTKRFAQQLLELRKTEVAYAVGLMKVCIENYFTSSTSLAEAEECWAEMTEAEQTALWVAPKFGGIFTTEERKIIKGGFEE